MRKTRSSQKGSVSAGNELKLWWQFPFPDLAPPRDQESGIARDSSPNPRGVYLTFPKLASSGSASNDFQTLSFKKWHFPNETVLRRAAQAEFQGHILVYYLIKQQKPTSKEQTWGPPEPLYPAARPSFELTRVTASTICQTLIKYSLLITLFEPQTFKPRSFKALLNRGMSDY